MIAQGITVLSYFLLSRLYSTAEFGAFNRFYSYVEILIILSTLRYELATPIAASLREAAAVARLSLILNTVFSVLLFPLILLLPKAWLPPFALLLPLMVFSVVPRVFIRRFSTVSASSGRMPLRWL